MRGDLPALERAFELAATGQFKDVREITRRLQDEDYPAAGHSLFGLTLRLKLRRAIASAGGRALPSA